MRAARIRLNKCLLDLPLSAGAAAHGAICQKERHAALWGEMVQQPHESCAGKEIQRPPAGSVRAKMRILIRQLLRKYKYPPEGYEDAIAMVLKQAEALAEEWTGR